MGEHLVHYSLSAHFEAIIKSATIRPLVSKLLIDMVIELDHIVVFVITPIFSLSQPTTLDLSTINTRSIDLQHFSPHLLGIYIYKHLQEMTSV